MKNLFNFVLKNIHWLLFFFLIFLSAFLFFRNNEFQRSKYLSVFQEIAGRAFIVSNTVESYMNLKKVNSDLLKRVAVLEKEVRVYQKELETFKNSSRTSDINLDIAHLIPYDFIWGRVVNNQTSGIENYITLDKGSLDGIESDMGVLSPSGIVGVVMNVSPHFSKVIPVLNPKFRLNCKLKHNDYSGPLVWDGKDSRYAHLEELPRHVTYSVGDTIVTSGYSTIFPQGIPVGIIVDSYIQKNDNFNSLKVKLFTDFNALSEVLIVRYSLKEEQRRLEKGILNQ